MLLSATHRNGFPDRHADAQKIKNFAAGEGYSAADFAAPSIAA
jgi:hypothetical protein